MSQSNGYFCCSQSELDSARQFFCWSYRPSLICLHSAGRLVEAWALLDAVQFHFMFSLQWYPRWFGGRLNKEWVGEERAYLSHSWVHCFSNFKFSLLLVISPVSQEDTLPIMPPHSLGWRYNSVWQLIQRSQGGERQHRSLYLETQRADEQETIEPHMLICLSPASALSGVPFSLCAWNSFKMRANCQPYFSKICNLHQNKKRKAQKLIQLCKYNTNYIF